MANQWAMDRAFYEIVAGQNARIAALEAQIARLTSPVTEAEVVDMVGTYIAMGRGPDAGHAALTAFLERRVKG